MKRAKKRPLPGLARLISSTRRADRALDNADRSIRRIELSARRTGKYTLAELLAQLDPADPRLREWDIGPPVGKEFGAEEPAKTTKNRSN